MHPSIPAGHVRKAIILTQSEMHTFPRDRDGLTASIKLLLGLQSVPKRECILEEPRFEFKLAKPERPLHRSIFDLIEKFDRSQ